ncbi:hypothetical protein BDW74DRAFT_18503 [Aspergillus multicolor]|uniref:uncharacterized protein n=1 Tax=Aspergillus multicolor TaxID=41759 RepID=UPI003CCD2372
MTPIPRPLSSHRLRQLWPPRYVVTGNTKLRVPFSSSTNVHVNPNLDQNPEKVPPWDRPLRHIDKTLFKDGYAPFALKKGAARWGFALFRTNYDKRYNTHWTRMIELLDETVQDSLEFEEPYDRLDLLPLHDLSVTQDRGKLHGASSHLVREHFTRWTEGELARILEDTTQPRRNGCIPTVDGNSNGADTVTKSDPLEHIDLLGPRFNFCLFIDEICLESLDEMPSRPVVKLLMRNWNKPADPTEIHGPYKDPIDKICDNHEYEDGLSNDPAEDVGWMYIQVWNYVEYFNRLVHEYPYSWDVWYRRPPRLEDYGGLDTTRVVFPGAWRKKHIST